MQQDIFFSPEEEEALDQAREAVGRALWRQLGLATPPDQRPAPPPDAAEVPDEADNPGDLPAQPAEPGA